MTPREITKLAKEEWSFIPHREFLTEVLVYEGVDHDGDPVLHVKLVVDDKYPETKLGGEKMVEKYISRN